MLPEGWHSSTLGQLGQIRSGSTPNRSKQKIYFDGGLWPWVKTMDLTNGAICSTDERITDQALAETSCRLFPAGSVLVAMYGGFKQIGRTGVLTKPSAVNQAISVIILDQRNAEPLFILHWLNAKVGLWRNFAASSRKDPNITREDVLNFPVALPPISEQRRIIEVLDAWDAAITTTEKLLANSRTQKSALLATLLMPVPATGRGRSVGDAYPASVQPGLPNLPPTPTGWRKTNLGRHLREVARPAALAPDEPYRLVTVRRSRGGVDERGVLLGSEIKTPTQFYVRAGDFLISKRQIVHGACGIVPPHLDGAIVSNEYAVLNADDELDTRFLAYLAETTYFQQTCFHSSIGVHVEKMLFKLDHWLRWPFNIPPRDVQRSLVEQLDLATEQIRVTERQLDLLRAEKRALMADLLTGKRRVRLPEASIVAQVAA